MGVKAEPKIWVVTRLTDFIKSLDQYGTRIELNYKGESTFKTFFGGICSIASLVGIIVYLIFQVKNVIEH